MKSYPTTWWFVPAHQIIRANMDCPVMNYWPDISWGWWVPEDTAEVVCLDSRR